MKLKIGDILYINPNKAANEIESSLLERPFVVKEVREKSAWHESDIAIVWTDGSLWWWGQIGSSQPWTNLFITEKEYKRDKILGELLK